VRAGFDILSAANDVPDALTRKVALPAASHAGLLLAAAVRALMEFPRPLDSAAELARLATSDQLAAINAHGAGKSSSLAPRKIRQCCREEVFILHAFRS
jgi:hypothetical protein